MSDKEKLIAEIEHFYSDVIEAYKEIELEVIRESSLSKIFKKTDYSSRIEGFRNAKKMALNINLKDITMDKSDEEGTELKQLFGKCISSFLVLCDSNLQMQTALKNKAERKNTVKMSDYKIVMNTVRTANEVMQQSLHNLDVAYADYTYDEDEEE